MAQGPEVTAMSLQSIKGDRDEQWPSSHHFSQWKIPADARGCKSYPGKWRGVFISTAASRSDLSANVPL